MCGTRRTLLGDAGQPRRTPGQTVLDMGCGNGFYTLPLAKMVGANGRVLAVDIQPEMLVMLRARAEQEGVENITPILGSVHDPRLPAESVDLALLVDVYHEFSHPEQMLAAMRERSSPKACSCWSSFGRKIRRADSAAAQDE